MKPNVILVFGDQWRAQATGYAGDPNVKTPNLDRFAAESIHFTQAVATCPVCSPSRATLLTGQHPLTHGVFVNDVNLRPGGKSIAEAFSEAGYDTAYIGKWHVDGHGRSKVIPPERQLGFDYWKVLECTHAYNDSAYFEGDSDEKRHWEGYDAIAQTRDAQRFITTHGDENPFLLILSWGPPHAPYQTAPTEYRSLYDPQQIELRPNVPENMAAEARDWLAGYYAHCSALDTCMGDLLQTISARGPDDNTIVLFISDHGDMLGSQGEIKKQRPWDESVRIPFLLRYPKLPNWKQGETDAVITTTDVMPTLLGLAGLPVPDSVEGLNYSGFIRGETPAPDNAALLTCAHPFGQWTRQDHGGKEFRGLRTRRHTYVRDLDGPWLLYNNEVDPFQMCNLVEDPASAEIREELDGKLTAKIERLGDEFLPSSAYLEKWGYTVNEKGTVPFEN
ncbi:MAG: sulfatase [Verrucomicrobia bacterium]|nr:MAG: sulfatase [Verrucomicrobiota bacterium]